MVSPSAGGKESYKEKHIVLDFHVGVQTTLPPPAQGSLLLDLRRSAHFLMFIGPLSILFVKCPFTNGKYLQTLGGKKGTKQLGLSYLHYVSWSDLYTSWV
jgi:hypothetical protein